jgi:hypothetical protein
MPVLSSVGRTLTLADVGTRVRITSTSGTAIIGYVPAESSVAWPDGAWVEFVYLGGARPSIDIQGEFGVTINYLNSGITTLMAGEYCRLTKVSGVANTWDMHIYAMVPQSYTAGEVLTSVGDGSTNWVTSLATPTYIYKIQQNMTNPTFGGSVFSDWIMSQHIDGNLNPMVTWDAVNLRFNVLLEGMYEITALGMLHANSGTFPNGLMSYGVDLAITNTSQNMFYSGSHFTRYSDTNPIPNGNEALGTAPQGGQAAGYQSFQAKWIGTFIGNTGIAAPTAYAYAYNNTFDLYGIELVFMFRKIGPPASLG